MSRKPFYLSGIISHLIACGLASLVVQLQAAEVDILVLYDRGVYDHYNGSPNTAIYSMVEQANTFYDNSLVDIELNIVGISEINVAGLEELRTNSAVNTLRDATGADFVSYIMEDFSGGCGVAYLTTSAAGAYNIVRRSCMSHSFFHEMGHNMGLGHSLAQDSQGSEYAWGVGYGVNGVFSTAMAYTSAYESRRRTYLYSNPRYECSGYPCGIVNVANAALAVNNVKDKVASHRQRPSLVLYGREQFTQSSENWQRITFDKAFAEEPIVVVGPPSFNGSQPTTVRIRNVTTVGFEMQIDEWDYLDHYHTSEALYWLAISKGEHNWNGLDVYAGITSNVTQDWKTVSFGENISSTPIVLFQKEVNSLTPAAAVRMRNVSSTGADFKIREEEANDNMIDGEQVHFIAISSGTGSVNGKNVRSGFTPRTVTDAWASIDFNGDYTNPLFIASIQTHAGSDPATLRYQNLGSAGVQIKVEEERSQDEEVAHVGEVVGWLVISD